MDPQEIIEYLAEEEEEEDEEMNMFVATYMQLNHRKNSNISSSCFVKFFVRGLLSFVVCEEQTEEGMTITSSLLSPPQSCDKYTFAGVVNSS